MTEDYLKMIKEKYETWRIKEKEIVNKENERIEKEIEKYNTIRELLKDERVQEFAKYIGYKEEKPKLIPLKDSLCDFLSRNMINYEWSEDILKTDEYPIYCFYKSEKPIYSIVFDTTISDYDDLYWNLQHPHYCFGPSDKKPNGKNREKFRLENIDNIIYPPKGKSFEDDDTFYKIQAEYVEEALKTNQKEAKKLLLRKYGKNNKTKD